MAFFLGLLLITLFVLLLSRWLKKGSYQYFWSAARLSTTIMFIQIGIIHLINPDALYYMIDGLLPYPKAVIILSGITEIIFALSLMWEKTRRLAAWLLILQLIAMFPANINVAVNGLSAPGGLPSEPWYTWSRLLFQPLYIIWVYKATLQEEKPIHSSLAVHS